MPDIFDQVAETQAPAGDIFDQVASAPPEVTISAKPKPSTGERIRSMFTGENILRGNVWSDKEPLLGRLMAPKPSDENLAALAKDQTPIYQAPLLSYESIVPERGVGRAAASFASGLTSPETLAMGVGAGKLGKLPVIGPAAGRAVSGLFGTSMAQGALAEDPELSDPDPAVRREAWTKRILSGGMAALAGRHAVRGETAGMRRESLNVPRPLTEPGVPIAPPPSPPPIDAGPVPKGPRPASESAQAFLEPGPPKSAAESAETLKLVGLEADQMARDRAAGRSVPPPLESPPPIEPVSVDRIVAAQKLTEMEAQTTARDRMVGPLPPPPPLYQESPAVAIERSGRMQPPPLRVPLADVVAATEGLPSPGPVEPPPLAPPPPVVPKPARARRPKPAPAEVQPAPVQQALPISAPEVPPMAAAERARLPAPPPVEPATPARTSFRNDVGTYQYLGETPAGVDYTFTNTRTGNVSGKLTMKAADWDRIAEKKTGEVAEGLEPLPAPGPVEPPPPLGGEPVAARGVAPLVPAADKVGERGAISPGMLGIPQMQRAFNAVPPTTPGEIYAKAKIAERESARSMGRIEGMWNKTRAAIARSKTELVDATAPILDAIDRAQKEHGYEIRPESKFEAQLDKSYRAKSMAAEHMKREGLIDIIQKVEDLDYFDQYLIARQAADVGAHGFKTGRDAVADAAMVREFDTRIAIPASGSTPAVTYRQLAQKVTEYSDTLLDYSVESGVVSPELATYLKQVYKDYVPIWRVFAEIEKSNRHQGPGQAAASLGSQTIVQRLQGSERQIDNPLASLVLKTADVFKQGERNKAAALLASYRNLPGLEGSIWEVPSGNPAPKHTITFFENGVKKTHGATKEWEAAAKSLDRKDLGLIGQILAAPARVFKIFTTGVSAPFTASNLAVDQLNTLVTSKYERSLLNPQAFGRAFLSAFSPKHTHLWDEVIQQGGGFTSFDLYRNEPGRNIQEIRAGRGVADRAAYIAMHPLRSMGDLLRLAEDTVSRTEQFGRARVYEMTKEALLKQGRTLADAQVLAAIESNNRLPNYLRVGNAMRPLNAVVPYLNASVQGTRSYLRALKENPASAITRTALTFYFPMALVTMWNLSDPERRKVYEDIPNYEKENNLIWIPPGSAKDKQGRYDVYKVKLTPGLNQLTVPLRRGIEQMYGLDPVQFSEIAKALFEFASPIPAGTKALTALPQAVKPTVQAVSNYDFFREKPIVPRSKEALPPNLQAYPWTSGTAKLIGGKVGASPIKTEQFIRDTIGGVAPQIMNASDRLLAAGGVIPKKDIGGEGPLSATLSRFSKARGGEQEHRVFEALRGVEEKLVAVEVEKTKRSPAFKRAADEAAQIKLLERAAARARAQVSSDLGRNFKKLSPSQKMTKINRVGQILERRGANRAPVATPAYF